MIRHDTICVYLRPAECEDAFLGEHVEGEGVDTLLVDDYERLALLAHFPLELDHLHHLRERKKHDKNTCANKNKNKLNNTRAYKKTGGNIPKQDTRKQ